MQAMWSAIPQTREAQDVALQALRWVAARQEQQAPVAKQVPHLQLVQAFLERFG
jgi:hypothetical protein